MAEIPTIRWAIIATGMISSWFVEDLILPRSDAPVKHVIQAIGSSSKAKGEAFVAKYCPHSKPTIYDSYEATCSDPEVDVVYIGTPHAFHKKNCLEAIAHGKNVLCEKAFTLNAREAREVFAAAKAKGVYIAEAMWLRHRPLFKTLMKLLYEDKIIGEVFRMWSDFGREWDVPNLPATSRYRDLALGAGTLLDLGIYSLTWGLTTLDPKIPKESETPKILAAQTFEVGIEVATSIVLHYGSSGRQGVITSTTKVDGNPHMVARIEGTKGTIEVVGPTTSDPRYFIVYPKFSTDDGGNTKRGEGKRFDFETPGRGYTYEADATALDIIAGKKESDVMPWSESVRVLEIMDEIRRQGGTVYAVDKD
ncbi:dimeric dihydrodiol dehydrogenase [Xylariaceae sp. FL1272]|nr:dimeric dihydrodiol dehydrogenase [Xylariaceae sp. FL1272]